MSLLVLWKARLFVSISATGVPGMEGDSLVLGKAELLVSTSAARVPDLEGELGVPLASWIVSFYFSR